MIYRKFYTCCFTGHRPKGLPWGYNEKSELCGMVSLVELSTL